jgi:ATP-dependent DNA helicase RecQ
VEPAPGGRLSVRLNAGLDRVRAAAACRVAMDRGWRAYRAVEAYSFSSTCRRRSLLDHFGDGRAGQPLGRCCDVCEPLDWLPSPDEIHVRSSRAGRREPAPTVELTAADGDLLEALKTWRLQAAAGKPAYTVAHNRTLEEIASLRPEGISALAGIHGIGPTFVTRHADDVLGIVAGHAPVH